MSEKKKLFGNVGGNQFRLLTEGMEVTADRPQGTEQVREGLKKVFINGGGEISYKRLQNVGLGYIKDVTVAARCALREAKQLAEEFGYEDDEGNKQFVKKESQSDSGETATDEKREVQIGKEILKLCKGLGFDMESKTKSEIQRLASELIQLHEGE